MLFDYYRYQLVPYERKQLGVFDRQITVDELIARKNEFFFNIIMSTAPLFKGNEKRLVRQDIYKTDQEVLFEIGNTRNKKIKNEFLEPLIIKDHPSSFVYINNDPNVQVIAISRNSDAFGNTKSLSEVLEENWQRDLDEVNLSLYISPIYKEDSFWELVAKLKDGVSWVKFELIKPNLANISRTLVKELKQTIEDTNSHKTVVKFEAPKGNTLDGLEKENENINGMVKYAEKGGGELEIKPKGGEKIKPSDIMHVRINEVDIKGSPIQVMEILRGWLKL